MRSTRAKKSGRPVATRLRLEPLERRSLMDASGMSSHGAACGCSACGGMVMPEMDDPGVLLPTAVTGPITGGAAAGSPLSSIPQLNSRVGAKATLYLDFDGNFIASWGGYSSITTPVFDQDGDESSFSSGELTTIQAIWAQVAEDYAPFDVNVTTVLPANFDDGKALMVSIGGGGAWTGGTYGGVAYVDSFTNWLPNVAFVFTANLGNGYAKYVGEATSHEAGHAFGLQHHGQYDANGNKQAEYWSGPGDGTAPIMGNSYYATRGLWWNGPASSYTYIQDDMAILSRAANGFGYRADDYGSTVGTAYAVTAVNDAFDLDGVITTNDDVDYFEFATGAGSITLTVGVPPNINNLDSRLRLYDTNGNLVADSNPTNSFNATITTTVAAGTYRLVVSSSGGYGNVGQYSLHGSLVAAAATVATPTSLNASASGGQVNLTWADNANNESAYYVGVSTNGVNWTTLATLSANANSYSDTSVVAGGTYYYRVWAANEDAVSQFSNIRSVTLAPTAPSGLTATVVSLSRIDLSWNDASGETGYRIERRVGNGSWTQFTTVGANATSYSNTGLSSNTTYSYRVVATNAGGSSAASNESTATTPLAPLAPTNFARTINGLQVNLTWTDNSTSEDYYAIERSADGQTWTTLAVLECDACNYEDSDVQAGGSYTYRVWAINQWAGTVSSQLTAGIVADAPTGLSASAGAFDRINLSWNDVAGETGYRIERSTSGGAWSTVATLGANVTTYTNTGLSAQTSYSYRVVALNAAGASDPSNTATAATPVKPGPVATPTGLKSVYSGGTVNLTWQDKATNESFYIVDRSTDGGTSWSTLATLGAGASSYSDGDLSAGTAYSYRVWAGNDTTLSTPSTKVTFTLAPDAPTSAGASLTSANQSLISWNDVVGETGYRIDRSTNGGATWTKAGTVGANVTSWTNTGLTADTSYTYRVVATNAGGASAGSNFASVTTGPKAPTSLVAKVVSAEQVNLTWRDNSKTETSYTVERSTDGINWSTLVTLGPNATAYSDASVAAGSTYSYRVVAANAAATSPASSKVSVTTAPDAPTSVSVSLVAPNQIQVSWNEVGGETGYRIDRSLNGGATWSKVGTVGANVTSWVNTNLAADTNYVYRVVATNAGGASANSNSASQTTAPKAPTSLTGKAISATQVNLTWKDASQVEAGYVVQRSSDNGASWTQMADLPAGSNSYSDTTTSAKTAYLYRVFAYNAIGDSGFSNVLKVTSLAAPVTPPSDVVANAVSTTRVEISWTDNAGNEQGYRIERSANGGTNWNQIGQVGANVTAYADTKVTRGATYLYRVRGYNEVVRTAASDPAQATVPASSLPAHGSLVGSALPQGVSSPTTFANGQPVPRATLLTSRRAAHNASFADPEFLDSLPLGV